MAPSVRGIARCGAGTNNCNVGRNTELGIPVFNTPGANANSVKELVICALFLAARDIHGGINHMKALHAEGKAKERVEKDKKMFAGTEVRGKTLGVVGMGAIGGMVAEAAVALGMKVVGYDPGLSVEMALAMNGREMRLVDDLQELFESSDYITLHAPYIPDVTHHMVNHDMMLAMRKHASILNFARGELVDGEAMRKLADAGVLKGRYVCDFPEDAMWDHPNCLIVPHLGASTEEAEENSASMAADTIMRFLDTGEIRHSVNFPTTQLPKRPEDHVRLCITTRNKPGMMAKISSLFADADINIQQQINTSRDTIAYNVVDIERSPPSSRSLVYKSWRELQIALTGLEGVLAVRFIDGVPGTGYMVNRDGKIL